MLLSCLRSKLASMAKRLISLTRPRDRRDAVLGAAQLDVLADPRDAQIAELVDGEAVLGLGHACVTLRSRNVLAAPAFGRTFALVGLVPLAMAALRARAK